MNKFLPIINNWKDYFQHRDEGLGTTYERLMLHQIFKNIDQNYKIKSVLEIPSFGMTGISGINSLWWARQEKNVTVIDMDEHRVELIKTVWEEMEFDANIIYSDYRSIPIKPSSFDMVWNFGALWFLKDISSFLNTLKRISCNIIFICVPNTQNIFFKLRKLLFGKNTDLNFDYIQANCIKEVIEDKQWHLSVEGYFDVPPWPDIPVKKEVLLNKLKLNFLLKKEESTSNPLSILEYFRGNEKDIENSFKKWQFLENSPKIIQRFWAHHRYFIFERLKIQIHHAKTQSR